jgi:hypothetical protein
MDTLKLKQDFNKQRHSVTQQRELAWELTFEQWLAVWVDSGHLELRGHGRGKYVLTRKKNAGAFKKSNVVVMLHEDRASQKSASERKAISDSQKNNQKKRLQEGFYGFVQTPKGIYASVQLAADAHTMTASGFHKRLKNNSYPDFVRLTPEVSKKMDKSKVLFPA